MRNSLITLCIHYIYTCENIKKQSTSQIQNTVAVPSDWSYVDEVGYFTLFEFLIPHAASIRQNFHIAQRIRWKCIEVNYKWDQVYSTGGCQTR